MTRLSTALTAITLAAATSACVTIDIDRGMDQYRACVQKSDTAERMRLNPYALRASLLGRDDTSKINFEAAQALDQQALDHCNLAVDMLGKARPGATTALDKSLQGTVLGTYALALFLRSELQGALNGPAPGDDTIPAWTRVHDADAIKAAAKAAEDRHGNGAYVGGNLLMSVKTLSGYLAFAKLRQGAAAKPPFNPLPAKATVESRLKKNLCDADTDLIKPLTGAGDTAAKIRHAVNRVRMAAYAWGRVVVPKLGAQPTQDESQEAARLKQFQTDFSSAAREHACTAVHVLGSTLFETGLRPSEDGKNGRDAFLGSKMGTTLKNTPSWSDLVATLNAMGLTGQTELKACIPNENTIEAKSWTPNWKPATVCN